MCDVRLDHVTVHDVRDNLILTEDVVCLDLVVDLVDLSVDPVDLGVVGLDLSIDLADTHLVLHDLRFRELDQKGVRVVDLGFDDLQAPHHE